MPTRLLVSLLSILFVLPGSSSRSAPDSVRAFHDLVETRQFATAYEPQQIATAYNYAPLLDQGIDGTGQTVALIEVDGFKPADIQAFDDAYNVPAPTITEYYAGNHTFSLEKQGETAMDIEWLHALAPGAAIQVYYLFNHETQKQSWKSLAGVLRQAADNGATTISISLGACAYGPGGIVARSALADVYRRGVSVFVASGDSGPHPGSVRDCGKKIGVSYPAGDPSVVAVGGTSVQLAGDNSISNESGWRLSGGGRLVKLPRPIWQVAHQLPLDSFRWVPDVAFLGDPQTGVSIRFNGGWRQAGGTSLGAPAWAAAWALIRQSAQQTGRTLGPASPLLYRLANSSRYTLLFHDIISGGNSHFQARPGWDAVTGWGTPDVAALAAALQSSSPAR